MEQRLVWKPLHRKVLVFLIANVYPEALDDDGALRTEPTGAWCGDCAAYITPVEGQNHSREIQSAKRHGEKLPKYLAEAIFGAEIERFEAAGVGYRE